MAIGAALYVVGLGLGPLNIGMLNDALAPTYGARAVRYPLLAVLAGLGITAAQALLANRGLPAEWRERSLADQDRVASAAQFLGTLLKKSG